MSDGETVTLQVRDAPVEAVEEAIQRGLIAHAVETGHEWIKQPLTIAARNPRGTLVGGLIGEVEYHWLHVRRLWVDAAHRRRGLGTRLVHAAEQQARRRHCRGIYLNTFGFQAPAFYEKLGYTIFGELTDPHASRRRVFLRKTLADGPDDQGPSADATSTRA